MVHTWGILANQLEHRPSPSESWRLLIFRLFYCLVFRPPKDGRVQSSGDSPKAILVHPLCHKRSHLSNISWNLKINGKVMSKMLHMTSLHTQAKVVHRPKPSDRCWLRHQILCPSNWLVLRPPRHGWWFSQNHSRITPCVISILATYLSITS